jgi:hypothetical protein
MELGPVKGFAFKTICSWVEDCYGLRSVRRRDTETWKRYVHHRPCAWTVPSFEDSVWSAESCRLPKCRLPLQVKTQPSEIIVLVFTTPDAWKKIRNQFPLMTQSAACWNYNWTCTRVGRRSHHSTGWPAAVKASRG